MTGKNKTVSGSLALKDRQTIPDETILDNVLGQTKPMLDSLLGKTTQVNLIWNYYNDGKAWLGKLMYRKKNLGWLHVFPGYFKITVYFTEKAAAEVKSLHLSEKTLGNFPDMNHTGRLIPFSVAPESDEDIEDILLLLDFKKSR